MCRLLRRRVFPRISWSLCGSSPARSRSRGLSWTLSGLKLSRRTSRWRFHSRQKLLSGGSETIRFLSQKRNLTIYLLRFILSISNDHHPEYCGQAHDSSCYLVLGFTLLNFAFQLLVLPGQGLNSSRLNWVSDGLKVSQHYASARAH